MFTYVEKKNEQVLGFVTGTTSANGLFKKIIYRDVLWFGLLFLRYIFTHPWNIFKMIRTLTYPGFSEHDPELLTIAVSGKSQKKGIGKKLFMETAGEFRKRKIRLFRISVYDRLPANGFYKKIGCKFDSSFDFLGEKMNYYKYNI